jgi:circadian clock protein KaiC
MSGISSLMDTWLLLRNVETPAGERNRLLFVIKSRGMTHSNQVREFTLTDQGIRLTDVYVGAGTFLTGSSRLLQEARDRGHAEVLRQEAVRRQRELEQEKAQIQAQIEALQHKALVLAEDIATLVGDEKDRLEESARDRAQLAGVRQAD